MVLTVLDMAPWLALLNYVQVQACKTLVDICCTDCVNMQITPEQGQLMAMLACLLGAKTYLEVGVFTGHAPLKGKKVHCNFIFVVL